MKNIEILYLLQFFKYFFRYGSMKIKKKTDRKIIITVALRIMEEV